MPVRRRDVEMKVWMAGYARAPGIESQLLTDHWWLKLSIYTTR